MKICYVCADLGILLGGHNGASAHIRNLLKAWTFLGHEVIAVTPSFNLNADLGVPLIPIPSTEIFESLSSEINSLSEDMPVDWKKKRIVRALGHLWNNVSLEKALRETFENYKPDFIYERYSPFCISGPIMAKRMNIPHILNVNAPLAWEGEKYRKQAMMDAAQMLEEVAVRSASHVVTTCRELKDEMLALGLADGMISIAPMGADIDLFTPEGPVRREGLEGKIVIGFVGSLKPWHGIEVLVEAFRELSKDPKFHLMIVGNGPMAGLLHKIEEELPGRISLIGNVPHQEVPHYVRAMDIPVAPYPVLEKFYFSPLKVLEYMSAGRAVVASHIGQISELILHGETGMLVPPGEVKLLVEAIQTLSADDALRQKLGEKASEEIRSKHTWNHRAKAILSLADKITGKTPASRSAAVSV
ncbi:MAG TPA: glycosyltransferase family 4 protein [bacterium]|nr:glycosyltransferase family 4 protein [bacterium]